MMTLEYAFRFTVYIEGEAEDVSELDALIDSTGAARSIGWPGHRVPMDCLQTRVAVLLGDLKRSSVGKLTVVICL